MARSTCKRTEEEKRNLKVDLSRIPEWESEIESIRSRFRRFSLPKISSAASLVHEMRKKLYIGRHSDRERDAEALENWKRSLSIDSLIRMSDDYSAPTFLRSGVEENIIDKIRSTLEQTERQLAEYRTRGVTDSFWVSVFTSKVDSDTVKRFEQQKTDYLALSREIPRVAEAIRLLDEVRSESREFANRVSKIKERLWLAEEKMDAIERFEAKHGRVFGKASAVDNKTRERASSLKRLVKKTKDCPYCGSELGVDPHLDHIYPVSKGGLSVIENLVWCCSACNTVKSDKGLMQFLKERGFSIDRALSRLHALGRHV